MDMSIQVQIHGGTDCISHSTENIAKGRDAIILSPVISK